MMNVRSFGTDLRAIVKPRFHVSFTVSNSARTELQEAWALPREAKLGQMSGGNAELVSELCRCQDLAIGGDHAHLGILQFSNR